MSEQSSTPPSQDQIDEIINFPSDPLNQHTVPVDDPFHPHYLAAKAQGILAGQKVGMSLLAQDAEAQRQRANQAEKNAVEAKYRADHDPLTGLLNGEAFNAILERRIAEAEKTERNLGLIMIDLKDFKKVNDTLGHVAGDEVLTGTAEVLIASAETLKETVRMKRDHPDVVARETDNRQPDVPARKGGDEFLVLVDLEPSDDHPESHLSSEERLAHAKNRIENNFRARKDITDTGVDITIGGAVWENGMTAQELTILADQSMYSAKQKQIEENGSYR